MLSSIKNANDGFEKIAQLVLLIVLVESAIVALAAEAAPGGPLRVAVAPMPPFVMKGGDGRWQGIAVELWEEIARKEHWQFSYQELPEAEQIDALAKGIVDLALTPLAITYENEKRFDFSHAYYSNGYGIVVSDQPVHQDWQALARDLLSVGFLQIVCLLAVSLAGMGWLVWMFERKRNPQFGGRDGFASGVWWAAVTMTTVGYGDKVPVTARGRLIAVAWFFVGLVICSSVTAHLSSRLTARQLRAMITRPEDLLTHRPGVVKGSLASAYLTGKGIKVQPFASEDEALIAVAKGESAAFVAPAAVLKYLISTRPQDKLHVLPFTLDRLDYAFAVPNGSALRNVLNEGLLQSLAETAWKKVLSRYLEE